MSRSRRIGVLGGMGPEATILLQQKLLAAVPARDDSDHIPLLIDMNPQVPSRIAHLIEGRGEDPTPVLIAMAKGLVGAGAEALAMPCNTAHSYLAAVAASVDVPFIDMIQISVRTALERAGIGSTIGVLASPATQKTGLFDDALGAAGLRPVWPDHTNPLLDAIRDIKARGVTAEARAGLRQASAALLAKGAHVQIIGCSEFSLIDNPLVPGATAIDTLDCLVQAICDFQGAPQKALV